MPTGSSQSEVTTTILGYYLNATISITNVYPTATGSLSSSITVPVASEISTSPHWLASNRIVSMTVPSSSVSVHLRNFPLGLAVMAIFALVF